MYFRETSLALFEITTFEKLVKFRRLIRNSRSEQRGSKTKFETRDLKLISKLSNKIMNINTYILATPTFSE